MTRHVTSAIAAYVIQPSGCNHAINHGASGRVIVIAATRPVTHAAATVPQSNFSSRHPRRMATTNAATSAISRAPGNTPTVTVSIESGKPPGNGGWNGNESDAVRPIKRRALPAPIFCSSLVTDHFTIRPRLPGQRTTMSYSTGTNSRTHPPPTSATRRSRSRSGDRARGQSPPTPGLPGTPGRPPRRNRREPGTRTPSTPLRRPARIGRHTMCTSNRPTPASSARWQW